MLHLILVWLGGSPYYQSNMITVFLNKLPEDLILDDEGIQNEIIPKWRAFVENLKEEGVSLTSKSGDPRSPWGVGYATPAGDVTYYMQRNDGTWFWKTK